MTAVKAVAIATAAVDELRLDLQDREAFRDLQRECDPQIWKQWREWWIHLVMRELIEAGEIEVVAATDGSHDGCCR